MPTFTYEAVARGGGRHRGQIEARTRAEACDKLAKENLQPLWLKNRPGKSSSEGQTDSGKTPTAQPADQPNEKFTTGGLRLRPRQIMQFTEELSDLLSAGLQLEQALRIMENRQESSSLKHVSAFLRAEVREGVSFSGALRKASPDFGELFCNLVSAGEQSGAMHSILKRSLDYQKMVAELKSKVVSALVYPAFIAFAGILLVVLFVTYLVPQLGSLLSAGETKMPLATALLIAGSTFLGHWWWAIGLGLVGLGFLARQFVRTPSGRAWWDRTQLTLPLIGPVLRAKFLAQFAQTLATLTSNGIALFHALKLTNAATPNVYWQSLLHRVTEDVGEGVQLSRSLARAKAFPPVFIDMVTVGEQTGNLPEAMEKAGQRYDKELNLAINTLTSMIQPAVIVVMAGIVGVVAYSMMGGIFQAVSGLRGN